MSLVRKLLAGVAALITLAAATLAQAAPTTLEARNKAVVEAFVNDVFVARNVDAPGRYLRADYI
jgi:hypothetical protein